MPVRIQITSVIGAHLTERKKHGQQKYREKQSFHAIVLNRILKYKNYADAFFCSLKLFMILHFYATRSIDL